MKPLALVIALYSATWSLASEGPHVQGSSERGLAAVGGGLDRAAAERMEEVAFITYAPVGAGFRLLDTCHFSQDGRRLLLTIDNPRQQKDVVRVYDVASGNELYSRQRARPKTIALSGEAISPDGSRIIVSEINDRVKQQMFVIDTNDGDVVWAHERSAATASTFLENADVVLVHESLESSIRRIVAVNVASGGELWHVEAERGVSLTRHVSMNGQLVFAVRDVKPPEPWAGVYSLTAKRLVAVLDGSLHLQTPHFRVAGDRTDVLGILDGKLARWDAQSGKLTEQFPLTEWTSGRTHAVFSPDGAQLYLREGNAITIRSTLDGALLHKETFSITPDLAAVGPAGLAVLRTIPGQIRIVRFASGRPDAN